MMQQVNAKIGKISRFYVDFFDLNYKAFKIHNQTIDGADFYIMFDEDGRIDNEKNLNAFAFEECTMNCFPSSETLKCVEYLERLQILNCKLTQIHAKDLYGLNNLTIIDLAHNEIEYLPEGLFNKTPNLEIVDFESNKIKWIHKDILEPLQKLKIFDLRCNSEFNVVFDEDNLFHDPKNVTLAELKEEIKNKFKATEKIEIEYKFKTMEKSINQIQETCAAQAKEIASLKALLEKSIPNDFTIKINGKDTKVNKEILIANSPLLAKLINENPEADHLELTDVSENTFESVLNYMKTQTLPNQEINLIELCAASGRLEMKELHDITAGMLMERVNPNNALEVLNLCQKYGNDELRQKALDEFKKTFPNA